MTELGRDAEWQRLDPRMLLVHPVREVMEGEPSQLLEHIAGRVARTVLTHDSRIERVRVKVSKLSPPLTGSTTGDGSVGGRS